MIEKATHLLGDRRSGSTRATCATYQAQRFGHLQYCLREILSQPRVEEARQFYFEHSHAR